MASANYLAKVSASDSTPFYVVKVSFDSTTLYFCEDDKVFGDWPDILPRLERYTPISRSLSIKKRVVTVGQTTILINDHDSLLKDLLLAGSVKNRSVIIYHTFEGLSEADSKVEFDAIIVDWSGIERISLTVRDRPTLWSAEINPSTTKYQIRSIAKETFPAMPDDEIHPVVLTINDESLTYKNNTEEHSFQAGLDGTFTVETHVTVEVNIQMVDIYEGTIVPPSVYTGALFNRTYKLSSVLDGVYTYPVVDVLGIEKTYGIANTDPFDIMLEILDDIDYPSAKIDTASFEAAKAYRPKWKVRRNVKAPTKAFDLLNELAESVNGFIVDKEGLLTMVLYRPKAPTDTLFEIDESVLLPGSTISLDGGLKNLANKIIINYNYDAAASVFNSVFELEDTDSQTDNLETRTLTINSKWIATEATDYASVMAMTLAGRYLSWLKIPVLEIKCKTSLAAGAVNAGDYVAFTSSRVSSSGFTDRRFLVLEKKIDIATCTLKLADATRLKGAVFASDDTPVYTSATVLQKEYAFFCNNTDPFEQSNGDEGSFFQ